jgi:general secretion pathway protein B
MLCEGNKSICFYSLFIIKMSYILDALKKADRERKLAETPQLHSVYPIMLNTYRQYPWTLIGIIVIINVVLLVLLLWTKTPPLPTVEKTPIPVSPESVESMNIQTVKPVEQVSPVQLKDNSSVSPSSLHSAKSLAEFELVSKENISISKNNGLLAQSTTKNKLPKTSLTDQVKIPSSPDFSTKKSQKLSPPSTPSQNTLLLLHEMPLSFQKSVPVFEMNVHVYSEIPKERFILMNGRRYTEGMPIREGGILESIRVNDIIVNCNQQRFRLKRP